MSEQNLTPRPGHSVVPASDSQAIKQGILSSIISAPVVYWGGAAVTTLLSTKNFISIADIGELYEEKFIDKNGEHRVAGKKLKNLAALPLVIVGRGKVSGYLQFSLEGIDVGALKGSASSLTFTDKFGEQHTENFSAVLDEDG